MNEQRATATSVDGQMYLYEQPELLSKEQHGNLGLSRPAHPFAFARAIRGVPIVAAEVTSAQKHYPVVFSGGQNPTLVAMVGVMEDVNLFVDDEGQWEKGTYVPSYLRRHPFAFAHGEGDQVAVVIDRASSAISDSPQEPFFENGSLAKSMKPYVDFCGQFEAERRKTARFCERVKELGLLTGQRATHQPDDGGDEKVIADYVGIDAAKLNDLDGDTLQTLFKDGYLSVIFAQLFSLENWNRLLNKRAMQRR